MKKENELAVFSEALPSAARSREAVQFDPLGEMPDTSALAKAEPGNLSIAISYHEFQEGEEVRGIYMGLMPYTFLSKYTNQEETIEAAVFVNQKKQIRLNGASLFVSALKNLPARTPFLAVMTGIKTKNSKNIQQFDVYLLQAPSK